jgi:hypothetical protein
MFGGLGEGRCEPRGWTLRIISFEYGTGWHSKEKFNQELYCVEFMEKFIKSRKGICFYTFIDNVTKTREFSFKKWKKMHGLNWLWQMKNIKSSSQLPTMFEQCFSKAISPVLFEFVMKSFFPKTCFINHVI